MRLHIFIFILASAFTVSSYASSAIDTGSDLPNLRVVNDHIMRGGRPTEQGLKDLQELGVKTIIDLEDGNSTVDNEIAAAAKLGVPVRSYQMSALWAPSRTKMNQIQADLQNPALYPIYIHCHHGQDRTGLIMGVYRVTVDHWPAKTAYNEMIADGFHPEFIALSFDFWDIAEKENN